jgi:hypothetical protein
MGGALVVVRPFMSNAWGTAHDAPIFSRVKQPFQFPRWSTKRDDGRTAMDTCILDLSMFIEHIFNPVHQQIRITQRLISVAGRSEE